MGDDVVSAIPGVLIRYSSWAQGLDGDLQRRARSLNDAIDVLAASQPDPRYLTIRAGDWVSHRIFDHTLADERTDEWVGEVGRAFLSIATRGLPAGLVNANRDDFLNGLVTTSQRDLAALIGGHPTAQLAPIPPIDGRRAWWRGLTAEEQAAYLAYDPADVGYLATGAQLQAAGFHSLQEVYYRQALLEAGIDPDRWDVTAGLGHNLGIEERLYAFYQHIYDADPSITWAGLAKLVGGVVLGDMRSLDGWRRTAESGWTRFFEGAEGFTLGGIPGIFGGLGAGQYAVDELRFYETEFLKIQKGIFDDMGPQAMAYLHGGVDAIRAMRAEGSVDDISLNAWSKISGGDIAAGNLLLAKHEQTVVVNQYYDQIRRHGLTGGMVTATLSEDAVSPVPGGTGFHEALPDGNLADVDDRWNWVQNTLMPDYQRFLQRPDARQVIDAPLDELASQYSLSPWSILPGD